MTIILNILSRYDHHPDHCLDRSCNHTGSQLLLSRWLLSHEISVNRLYDAQVFSTRIFKWYKKTRTKKIGQNLDGGSGGGALPALATPLLLTPSLIIIDTWLGSSLQKGCPYNQYYQYCQKGCPYYQYCQYCQKIVPIINLVIFMAAKSSSTARGSRGTLD